MCVCIRSGFNFPCVHCFSVICTEFQMPLYCFCMSAPRAVVKCLLPLESTHPLINVLPVSLCSEMVEPCELFSLTCYPSDLLVIVKASPLTSVQLSTSFSNYSHQSWTQYPLGDHSSVKARRVLFTQCVPASMSKEAISCFGHSITVGIYVQLSGS